MAEKLGIQPRGRRQDYFKPNPHIDPFGSIALPLLLLAVGSPIVLARPGRTCEFWKFAKS